MDLKEPPLGGCRGTDPMDVVVWFGDASSGWSQRVLTVQGVLHRGGEDAHSKHAAAARELVDHYYAEEASSSSAGHSLLPDDASTDPMVKVIGLRSGLTVRDRRLLREPGAIRRSSHTTPSDSEGCDHHKDDNGEGCDHHKDDNGEGDDHHKDGIPESRHVGFPLEQSRHNGDCCESRGSLGSGQRHPDASHITMGDVMSAIPFHQSNSEYENRSNHSAWAGVRDSPSLMLKRRHEGNTTHTQITSHPPRPNTAQSTGSRVSKGTAAHHSRPASSLGRSSQHTTHHATSNGEGEPSHYGFPASTMCRDLRSTIALTRAAAVSASIDKSFAAQQAEALRIEAILAQQREVPGGVGRLANNDTEASTRCDETTTNAKRPKKLSAVLSSSLSAAPSPSLDASGTATTLNIDPTSALERTLGNSIMHTIRQTNLEQCHHLDTIEGPKQHNFTHKRLAEAERRKPYQFLPKDYVEKLLLRDSLEELQTRFAKKDIENDIDSFKRRKIKAQDKTSAPVASSISTAKVEPKAAAATEGVALLKAMVNARKRTEQQRLPLAHVMTSVGQRRSGVDIPPVAHPYVSHQHHRDEQDGGKVSRTPAQSRVTIAGKTFEFSEIFRRLGAKE